MSSTAEWRKVCIFLSGELGHLSLSQGQLLEAGMEGGRGCLSLQFRGKACLTPGVLRRICSPHHWSRSSARAIPCLISSDSSSSGSCALQEIFHLLSGHSQAESGTCKSTPGTPAKALLQVQPGCFQQLNISWSDFFMV